MLSLTSGHKFEQTPGDSEGILMCCSPWGCKESNTTEQLSNHRNNNSKNKVQLQFQLLLTEWLLLIFSRLCQMGINWYLIYIVEWSEWDNNAGTDPGHYQTHSNPLFDPFLMTLENAMSSESFHRDHPLENFWASKCMFPLNVCSSVPRPLSILWLFLSSAMTLISFLSTEVTTLSRIPRPILALSLSYPLGSLSEW